MGWPIMWNGTILAQKSNDIDFLTDNNVDCNNVNWPLGVGFLKLEVSFFIRGVEGPVLAILSTFNL